MSNAIQMRSRFSENGMTRWGSDEGKKNQAPGLGRDSLAGIIVAENGQVVPMQGELDIAGVILILSRYPNVETSAHPTFMNMGGNLTTFPANFR